jgi:hypothetical protein
MTRRFSVLLLGFACVAAGGFSLARTSPAAQPAASGEMQYLAFQIFTGATNPRTPPGSQAVLDAVPSRAQLDAFGAELIARIGGTGRGRHRLALIFGPIAFDHSDQQAASLIHDAFDIALARDVAVGFHLDDSMFWGGRRDLINDPRNIERADWEGPPSTARRLDWGPVPARITPQMCLNSPAVEAEVRRRGVDVIGPAIRRGLARLHAARREDLFAGVIVGWETHIGVDFENPRRALGYCVLANRGLKAGATAEAMDAARVAAVEHFITLWSQAIAAGGVPETRIYSHVAFAPRQTFAERGPERMSYAEATLFAPSEVAFGASRRAGFSTYPAPDLMEEIYADTARHGGAPWASAEGANVDLPAEGPRGGPGSGMDTETYLARQFNHGAVLVNLFGWGIDDTNNRFRRAAANPDAIMAYRKFLRGETLVEGSVQPTIQDRLPPKIHRIQAEMPAWISGDRNRQARAQLHLDALAAAMAAKDLTRAEREADALLALLDGT